MRRSHHEAWVKVLACCFIVVAIMCVVLAVVLANVDGEDGADGITITDVQKTTEGNVDTYTVYYSDNTTYSFTVSNGTNGTDGNGIEDISSATSADGLTVTYTVTYTSGGTYEFDVTNGNEIEDVTSVIDESASTITYTFTMTDGSTQTSTVSYTPYITDVTVNSDGTITLTYSGNATGTTADSSSGTTIYTKTIDDVKSVSSIVRDGRYIYVISSNSSDNVNTDNITVGNYAYTVDLCCVHGWKLLSELTEAEKNCFGSADLALKNTTADCENIGVTYYYCPDCGAIKTVITAATGHSYDITANSIVWKWSDDYSYASATFACTKCNHTETIAASILSETTNVVSCTSDGETTYTATVSFNGNTYTDIKTVTIPATGHDYVATWEWTEDGSGGYTLATLTLTCATDSNHKEEYNVNLNTEVTAVSCTVDGSTTYTATYTTTENITYTDTKTVITATATGHSYGDEVEIYDDGCTMVYASVCGVCADTHYTTGSLLFTLSDDSTYYTVSRGTYTGANVVIPSTYNGLSVTAVGDLADNNYVLSSASAASLKVSSAKSAAKASASLTADSVSTLTYAPLESVYIPSSVTTIAAGAFAGCSSLKELTLPFVGANSTVSTATAEAMFGYIFGTASYNGGVETAQEYTSGSSETYYIPASLKTVTVTGGNLKRGAFYNCTTLETVTLQSGVKALGNYSFYGCTALKSITIDSSNPNITEISSSVFYGCTSLTSVSLTSVITEIGNDAFRDCSSLVSITIPSSVQILGEGVFRNCSALVSVIVPDSVTTIGASAFKGCTSLESITLPFVGNTANASTASETTLFGYIFGTSYYGGSTETTQKYGSNSSYSATYYIPTSLTTVTITGAGSSSLLYGAFYGCTTLTTAKIDSSITTMGTYAFYNCSALTGVYYNGTSSDWASITFTGGGQANPLYYAEKLYINDTLVTQISLEGITTVKEYAFYNCTALTNVTFGDSITSLNTYSFFGCKGLETIAVPDNVTTIGIAAFGGCSGLADITLPFVGGSASANEASISTLFGYIFGTDSYDGGTKCSMSYKPPTDTQQYYIPTNLKNVTITGGNILQYAFYGLNGSLGIESITIGGTVTSIGNNAFYEVTGVNSVILGDNVTEIGNDAFNDCDFTSITFGSGVTTIGTQAFAYCYYLTEINYNTDEIADYTTSHTTFFYAGSKGAGVAINIGANVTRIPNYLFYNNSIYMNIASINFADGSLCEEIGDYAFFWNQSDDLQSLDLSKASKLTSIGNYAFGSCYGLLTVTLPEGLKTIGTSAFGFCNHLQSIEIPETVTSIGGSAFDECSSLVTVNIPNNITVIENCVFQNCKFSSITIPSGVTSIGQSAFESCSNLTSITIPDSVLTIGSYAFEYCSLLANITIGSSVTSIGTSAFYGCYKLAEVYYTGSDLTDLKAGNTSNGYLCYYAKAIYTTEGAESSAFTMSGYEDFAFIADEDGNYYLLEYTGSSSEITLPTLTVSGETKPYAINNSVFYSNKTLTSVIIPNTVTSVGSYAFYSCSSLESVTFGEYSEYTMTSIGDYAFYYCTSLTSVNIPSGVTSIGTYAFGNCTSLTSVYIPSSLNSTGSYAFYGCSSLEGVYITDIEAWCKISFGSNEGSNPLQNVCDLYLYGTDSYELLTELTIPESITDIGTVFRGCTSITTVKLNSNITSLSGSAFYNCSSLQSIDLDNVTSIGTYAFYNCSSLTTITLNTSIKTINSSTFYGCTGLTSINLGNITKIDSSAFRGCSSLTSVDISSVTTLNGSAFYECTSLTSIVIPDGLKTISSSAFYGCTGLTSLTIGSGVTTIGTSAFDGCTGLTEIKYNAKNVTTELKSSSYVFRYAGQSGDGITLTIGASVTKIPAYLFYASSSNYVNITSVVFEGTSACTSIGNYAFYYCKKLTSITIPASVTKIGQYAFRYCSALASVTFETTSGWYSTSSSGYTGGSSVTVTNVATAATYLKTNYTGYYWYRSE